jgi:hypothetical protein
MRSLAQLDWCGSPLLTDTPLPLDRIIALPVVEVSNTHTFLANEQRN